MIRLYYFDNLINGFVQVVIYDHSRIKRSCLLDFFDRRIEPASGGFGVLAAVSRSHPVGQIVQIRRQNKDQQGVRKQPPHRSAALNVNLQNNDFALVEPLSDGIGGRAVQITEDLGIFPAVRLWRFFPRTADGSGKNIPSRRFHFFPAAGSSPTR